MTEHEGSVARYVAGCRCAECRKASAAAVMHRTRAIAYGRWQPFTDAAPVREHLRVLHASGIGIRRAAELSGVSQSTVTRIYYQCSKPMRRVRPETAAAILAIRPGQVVGCTRVDATGTVRRLQALVAAGHPPSAIAARLGWYRAQLTHVMKQDKVTAATAASVRAAYDEMWDESYEPASPQQRVALAKALEQARQEGFAPPMAWDDDEIDDPKARPKGLRRDSEAAA